MRAAENNERENDVSRKTKRRARRQCPKQIGVGIPASAGRTGGTIKHEKKQGGLLSPCFLSHHRTTHRLPPRPSAAAVVVVIVGRFKLAHADEGGAVFVVLPAHAAAGGRRWQRGRGHGGWCLGGGGGRCRRRRAGTVVHVAVGHGRAGRDCVGGGGGEEGRSGGGRSPSVSLRPLLASPHTHTHTLTCHVGYPHRRDGGLRGPSHRRGRARGGCGQKTPLVEKKTRRADATFLPRGVGRVWGGRPFGVSAPRWERAREEGRGVPAVESGGEGTTMRRCEPDEKRPHRPAATRLVAPAWAGRREHGRLVVDRGGGAAGTGAEEGVRPSFFVLVCGSVENRAARSLSSPWAAACLLCLPLSRPLFVAHKKRNVAHKHCYVKKGGPAPQGGGTKGGKCLSLSLSGASPRAPPPPPPSSLDTFPRAGGARDTAQQCVSNPDKCKSSRPARAMEKKGVGIRGWGVGVQWGGAALCVLGPAAPTNSKLNEQSATTNHESFKKAKKRKTVVKVPCFFPQPKCVCVGGGAKGKGGQIVRGKKGGAGTRSPGSSMEPGRVGGRGGGWGCVSGGGTTTTNKGKLPEDDGEPLPRIPKKQQGVRGPAVSAVLLAVVALCVCRRTKKHQRFFVRHSRCRLTRPPPSSSSPHPTAAAVSAAVSSVVEGNGVPSGAGTRWKTSTAVPHEGSVTTAARETHALNAVSAAARSLNSAGRSGADTRT